jgi:hypothetical protein
VHDNNNFNNGQIGQVVAMGGSGKTQDFFLCLDFMLTIMEKKKKKG